LHKIQQLIKQINKTHKHLGELIAMNIIAAKAKKTILNVAPAGCGKSTATDTTYFLMRDRTQRYTSLTLAGLKQIQGTLRNFDGHIIIDDLGADRSLWARVSTITVLADLVYKHYVHKVTQQYELTIENFYGSVSMNIQPVLMNTLAQTDEWIAVVRDKVIRYYHLYRPKEPIYERPHIELDWGEPFQHVKAPKMKGQLWYQLVYMGLTQWSYARVKEHVPDMLRALAALDGRTKVNRTDYHLLIKLMQPLQLERYIIKSYGFETGRVFDNNLYCVLVELASFGTPTILQLCEDYKISPENTLSILSGMKEHITITEKEPKRIAPKKELQDILELCGVKQKWQKNGRKTG